MPTGLKVSDIIAITGHRDYPDPGAFYKGLDNLRAKEYVFGGARGADTDALKYLARTQPGARRTVVVPNRVIDQPVASRDAIRKYGQKVIELKNRGADRYQIRNRFMVNRSTHTRAFYDFRGRGGTFNTINYAKSSGKSFDVWTVKQFDQERIMRLNKREFDAWLRHKKDLNVNLESIKRIVIEYLKNVLRMGTREYMGTIGVAEYRMLEEYFGQ